MNRRQFIQGMWFISLFLAWNVLLGQEGEAGIEDPFSIGVGARALGLGSAAVAFPDDPSAFTWNPAGMVVVDQKEVGLSLTTLFEGTQYNFIGYIYPTMTMGVLGFGIERIGTNSIVQRHWDRGVIVEQGEVSYWWGKFILSYALTTLKGLSAGINFGVNRQVLGAYSTNGFGVDIGIHYEFPQKNWILKNLFLGFNIVNAISPRLKLGFSSETVPYNIKIGMAKVFFFRKENDRWLVLADLEKAQDKGLRYHVGTEYSLNKSVFIRMGFNNGEVAFGGGVRYQNFQLDYGMNRIADPEFFPRSHRFSLIFYIGKDIPEQKQLLEEQRQKEVQRRIGEMMEVVRQKRIREGIQAGKEFLEKEDCFNARLEFARVLMEEKENQEAQELLSLTTNKEQALQKEREEELIRKDREKEKRQQDNIFVNQRFKEGLEALEKGDFREAIDKWQQALQRDPDNPQINAYVQKAKVKLENEVNNLLAKAKQLIRQENLSKAYQVLDLAKNQATGNSGLQNKVVREIKNLDRIVDFLTNYQAGIQRYGKGEYEVATRFFQKALEYNPKHSRTRELYQSALARSKGSNKEMKGEVKEKFYRGLSYYSDGRYEEALKVWEQALELDPHNVRLLEAIEGARNKLETYKK